MARRISELPALAGASFADLDLAEVVDVSDTTDAASGSNKKITLADLKAFINPTVVKSLSSNFANSTVTPTEVAALTTALAIGQYQFEYTCLYQTAATTTGIRLSVNFTGTQTGFAAEMTWVDVATSATATMTRAPTQANQASTTGGIYNSIGARAPSSAGWGTSVSVDAANSDLLMTIRGIIVVSVAGNLQLYMGSEIAASAATLRPGTNLILTKVG